MNFNGNISKEKAYQLAVISIKFAKARVDAEAARNTLQRFMNRTFDKFSDEDMTKLNEVLDLLYKYDQSHKQEDAVNYFFEENPELK